MVLVSPMEKYKPQRKRVLPVEGGEARKEK
jgi:hypothetical protein